MYKHLFLGNKKVFPVFYRTKIELFSCFFCAFPRDKQKTMRDWKPNKRSEVSMHSMEPLIF